MKKLACGADMQAGIGRGALGLGYYFPLFLVRRRDAVMSWAIPCTRRAVYFSGVVPAFCAAVSMACHISGGSDTLAVCVPGCWGVSDCRASIMWRRNCSVSGLRPDKIFTKDP